MKTPSMYRLQARESLKNHWVKSALATLVFYLAIITPSMIVVLCTKGFNATSTSFLWTLLALISGFGVVPFTYAFCVAFLNYIRTKETTLLQDAWRIGIKNYGRFLGAYMIVYLISLAIGGLMSFLSFLLESSESLFLILIYTIAVFWSFFLLLQVMYAYRMVPYILHDNPQLKVIAALKKSSQMMQGNKLLLFRLDISLFQWYLYALILTLCLVVLGEYISSFNLVIISGVTGIVAMLGILLCIYPYICTISAHFYDDLQAEGNNEITDEETLPEQGVEDITIEK